MVAIEGPFGTGKTALIADALARRPWVLRQNAAHVSTVIITPSHKAALNGALALRKAGANFKYACSMQYCTIMVENGMGQELLTLEG
jgi:ribose 1,5-bisphosphokinase PhnN